MGVKVVVARVDHAAPARRRVTGRIDRSIHCASDRAASARPTRTAAGSSRSSLVLGGAPYRLPSACTNPTCPDADRVIFKRPTWTAS
ncbi:MAG: hypothetical protein KC464_13855, partial [Myxococcales bacterium]|nr:hypothetical protein [Myxococcales bacterium]